MYFNIIKVIYDKPGLPKWCSGKASSANAGDKGSIPGTGRSPGEGNSYPLQYSCLENSMDCIVHGVAKSWTQLSYFQFQEMTLIKRESESLRYTTYTEFFMSCSYAIIITIFTIKHVHGLLTGPLPLSLEL